MWACAGFVALAAAISAGETRAEIAPPAAVSLLEPREPIVSYNGAFRERIPIEVPPFRGLEPELELTYSSSRQGLQPGQPRTGWLGVGWALSGIDVIERAAPFRGTPRFDDAADVFLLDGEELVACTPAMTTAPSCLAGGTHAARVESYRKIVRSGANWQVFDRDGTKYEYRPAGEGQGAGAPDPRLSTDYRWLLRSVTDTHGNVVNYAWSCTVLPDCHPTTITYGNYTIRFHWSDRSNPITYATGLSLGAVSTRLKTIEMQLNGSRIRAYKLDYNAGESTRRSRLGSVQQFGRDAVLDASGTVTGGSALPAILLPYSDVSASATWTVRPATVQPKETVRYQIGSGSQSAPMPCDISVTVPGSSQAQNWPINPCPQVPAPPSGTTASRPELFLGDFNGDKIRDVVVVCCSWVASRPSAMSSGGRSGSVRTRSCSS